MSAATLPLCPVCGVTVHLLGVDVHPCCARARARGESGCGACRAFMERRKKGEG